MIQTSGYAALMAGIGEAALLCARPGPTAGSTIALAPKTMAAEQERDQAAGPATADFQKRDRFFPAPIRHALAMPALDNRKPFLSPLENN